MAQAGKWIKQSSPDSRVLDVAVHSVRTRMDVVLQYLPRAACHPEESVEHVHQLRVATRRAVAALGVYRDLLPRKRTRKLRKCLRFLRRAAGAARDCDVMLARHEGSNGQAGAARFVARIRALRAEAQRPIRSAYEEVGEGRTIERQTEKLLRVTERRARSAGAGDLAFGPWAARRLRPVVDAFFAAGKSDLGRLEALHQLRIAAKKLRYTMELLAGAFPPAFRQELYPHFMELQDQLGEIHDHAIAQTDLTRWIDASEGGEEAAFLRSVRESEVDALAACLDRFDAWWTPKRGRALRVRFDEMTSVHGDE